MKKILSAYLPSFPLIILYMLQASEYNVRDYVAWLGRVADFRTVMKRKKLVWTQKIKLLALVQAIAAVAVVLIAWLLLSYSIWLSLLVLILLPAVFAYGIVVPLLLGRWLIQGPRERRIIAAAHQKILSHPARKIAIVGSYGKTTTKEVLRTILAEKYKVAATPGNMNTPIGTSRFIASLTGDEEILLFEFGESHVGDIKELCEIVHPDIGIMTGINQAHLETFGTIENTIATMYEIADFLKDGPIYVNADDNNVVTGQRDRSVIPFGRSGVDGWVITESEATLQGDRIVAERDGQKITVQTQMIGEHLFGLLLLSIAIADKMGLSETQIVDGMQKIRPFEHRMQPRELHGALIIDDTYNGNSKGVEAGLALLKDSGAKRRVYVTPGLVEQGDKTVEVHQTIGEQIAVSADVAVLMNNSVTTYIKEGLDRAKFGGQLIIVDDPLAFYEGLEHFVAAGDVVLMQNDWTDNYA